MYICIYKKNRAGLGVGRVPNFRPFSLSPAITLPRRLKARFSFPNGSPNGSKIASGCLLEAIGSDNSILHRSKQDFHRFNVHTKVQNLLKTEGFLKILLVRHFRLSSSTKSSQTLKNRLKIDLKTVPNPFRSDLGSICILELDFWSLLSSIWTSKALPKSDPKLVQNRSRGVSPPEAASNGDF